MKLNKYFFVFLAAVVFFQFSFFGLKYYEVLDDNNQLGCYNIVNDNIYENIITTNRAYSVRPLAFVSDSYVFQWFWDNMYALLAIILIMHICNLFFLHRICEKIDIKLNAFCLILFALSPVLVEGLYWISASTRIVVSLFFLLTSIYLLLKSFDEEKKKRKIIYLISSVILNLLCVGYYEQTVALNLFLFAFVLICLKKYKYLWVPVLSTTWIGVWYISFMISGKMQARGTLNLSGIFNAGLEVVKEVYTYYQNEYYNFLYSLNFGKEAIFNSIASIALIILVGGFIYFIYKNRVTKDESTSNSSVYKKLILGGIIFITPFLPFLVLESSTIALRNLYMPTLGIAIIIGVLVDLILKLIKNETACNIIKTVFISIAMISFIVSNIASVENYKKVNAIDNKVVKQIVNTLDNQAFEEYKTISINFNEKELFNYKNLSNYVQSVVETNWAMMGKIQVYRNDVDVGLVYVNSMQDEADYTLYFDKEMNLASYTNK